MSSVALRDLVRLHVGLSTDISPCAKNSIDIKVLREFCEREGKEVTYRKGD